MCVMSDILSLAPENFYREEIRSGYKISPEMKKIWACQLNLLAELQKVCDRNGLKYWLDSGSLLGAIRHQGYIPWDDDIDVVMFRDDYDRLVKLSKEELGHLLSFRQHIPKRSSYGDMHSLETQGLQP